MDHGAFQADNRPVARQQGPTVGDGGRRDIQPSLAGRLDEAGIDEAAVTVGAERGHVDDRRQLEDQGVAGSGGVDHASGAVLEIHRDAGAESAVADHPGALDRVVDVVDEAIAVAETVRIDDAVAEVVAHRDDPAAVDLHARARQGAGPDDIEEAVGVPGVQRDRSTVDVGFIGDAVETECGVVADVDLAGVGAGAAAMVLVHEDPHGRACRRALDRQGRVRGEGQTVHVLVGGDRHRVGLARGIEQHVIGRAGHVPGAPLRRRVEVAVARLQPMRLRHGSLPVALSRNRSRRRSAPARSLNLTAAGGRGVATPCVRLRLVAARCAGPPSIRLVAAADPLPSIFRS